MDFAQIEQLIKEDPKKADDLASKWQQFAKQNPDTLPTDSDILLGKEIEQAYFYLRDQNEDRQMQTQGSIDSASLPAYLSTITLSALTIAYGNRPKVIEEDKDYQKLVEKHQELWLKKNNAKNFDSKEGLDYLYGSLEDESEGAPALKKDAEQEFRNNPKFKKRAERYDKQKKKVYKKLDEDPSIINTSYEIQNHTISRLAYLKTHEDTKTSEEMSALIKKRSWERFVAEHPEKAKVYAQTDIQIKKAYEKQEIKKQLSEIEQQTGKRVRYVEKTHRPQKLTAEEASRKLESIIPTPPRSTSPERRATITVEGASRRLEPIVPPPPRSILLEHGATISQTERPVGRGENVEIRDRRQFRPQTRRITSFGSQGTRLAARAGMAAGKSVVGWLASNSMGLLAIGLPVFLIIAVFIIIILEGGGGFGGGRRVPTFECVDADGKRVLVSNGNACAQNYAAYYSKLTGEAITAGCRDKCTDFISIVCDRNPANNMCDEPPLSCGAPPAFCFEYSVAAPRDKSGHSTWRHDCSNLDGFDYGSMPGFGVDSCDMAPIAPTPTP